MTSRARSFGAPSRASRRPCSPSAGASDHGDSFEALFTTADRALFESKRAGRDRVTIAGASKDATPQLLFNRFVGRAREMRSLVTALDSSVHGAPQTRVLTGEAGVGQSSPRAPPPPQAPPRRAPVGTGPAPQ